MSISRFLTLMLKEFLIACGGLMILVALYQAMNSPDHIRTSVLWQIAMFGAAATFYKNGLMNHHELGKKAERITFFVCVVLANSTLILWLLMFSTHPFFDKSMFILLILIVFVIEIMVHSMMYIDSKKEAKQLNDKLHQFNNPGNGESVDSDPDNSNSD
ncbi:hypothetical protein [Paenibacillus sp. sgz500958]|uniref:hypothetical protein n=1 Tax=Paenibacillus sp. sgz500958 TaxID=3242475 RepID=UPI0036D32D1D